MARFARIVIPGIAHHIIQRGSRRQNVFFSDEDKKIYLDYLFNYAKPVGLRFLGYCLMDNHIHLIVIPNKESSLATGLGEAHRRYTRRINFMFKWRGNLWEGRFKSYPLSEVHLYNALRYVENNPVNAGIVKIAEDYPWSSAAAHVQRNEDRLLDNSVYKLIEDWPAYLHAGNDSITNALMNQCEKSGRPLGDIDFIRHLEKITQRKLLIEKRGPKKKIKSIIEQFKVSLN